jgi:hypothetical protein
MFSADVKSTPEAIQLRDQLLTHRRLDDPQPAAFEVRRQPAAFSPMPRAGSRAVSGGRAIVLGFPD